MTASVGQFGHVVDVNGTGLHASVTGGAGPNGVLSETGDDVLLGGLAGKQGCGVVVGVLADVVNDLHRVERFAAGVGGTHVLTASAGGAGPAVDEVAPGEVGVVHGAKRLQIEFVKRDGLAVFAPSQWLHRGHRSQVVEEHVREGHDQVHVLGERDEEKEDADGQHVRPVSGDDHAGRRNQRAGHPVTDGLPGGGHGGLTGFDHERGGGDGHDEQQDDVALQLGLTFEFLRGEHHAANQRQHAPDEGDGVARFDHQIPRASQGIGKHVLREFVPGGEVEHVGGEHEEPPEHEDVNAARHAVLEDLFLTQPAAEHFGNTSAPVVKPVLGFAFEDEARSLDHLIGEKSARHAGHDQKNDPTR